MLDVWWKSWFSTGLIFGGWTIVIGYMVREPLTMVIAPWVAIYSFGVSIPIAGLCVLIRKRIRPLDADNFIRCRVSDYRVDNVTGPRCPECGTVIDGSYDAQT